MAMEIGHVHIKTYDPKKTAQFYIENFGATMKNEAPNGNIQLDLHGLQLNVTTISTAQKRKQMMGIEHIALQTDDYALAIIRLNNPEAAEETQLRRLQARMARRTVLTRHSAPSLRVLIDESALRRPIGGPDAMRRQLAALLEAAERPHVHLQIAPTTQADFPGMEGSFVILSFASQIALDVVYIKNVAGGIYVEDVEQVRRCSAKFEAISEQALSEAESITLIEALLMESNLGSPGMAI